MATQTKTKRLVRGSREWERRADNLARSFVEIRACASCNGPYVRRYCCTICGSKNPEGALG